MLNHQSLENLSIIQSDKGVIYFGCVVSHSEKAIITKYVEIIPPKKFELDKSFFQNYILREHANELEDSLTLEGRFIIAKKALSSEHKFTLTQTLAECKHHLQKAQANMEVMYIRKKMC